MSLASHNYEDEDETLPRPTIEALNFSLGQFAVIDERLSIRYENQAFSDLLAAEVGGLCLRSGRLSCVEPGRAARLKRWLTRLFGSPSTASPLFALEREDQPPLLLRGKLLHAMDFDGAAGAQGLAIISAHDVMAERSLSEASKLFELTAAEQSVAEHMLSGTSTRDLLSSLEISENTLRTHLKSIYRKIYARNQADLIRLLKDVSDVASSSAHMPTAIASRGRHPGAGAYSP